MVCDQTDKLLLARLASLGIRRVCVNGSANFAVSFQVLVVLERFLAQTGEGPLLGMRDGMPVEAILTFKNKCAFTTWKSFAAGEVGLAFVSTERPPSGETLGAPRKRTMKIVVRCVVVRCVSLISCRQALCSLQS